MTTRLGAELQSGQLISQIDDNCSWYTTLKPIKTRLTSSRGEGCSWPLGIEKRASKGPLSAWTPYRDSPIQFDTDGPHGGEPPKQNIADAESSASSRDVCIWDGVMHCRLAGLKKSISYGDINLVVFPVRHALVDANQKVSESMAH